MIRVTIIETTYPAPEDDETDYCPDGETETVFDDAVGFRELVTMLRGFCHPSESPCRDPSRHTWVSSEAETDYRTGDSVIRSIHLSHESPDSTVKYWKAAFRAAGIN